MTCAKRRRVDDEAGYTRAVRTAPPLIRFGSFEVDTGSGELRRQGVRVSLQEQPFQALIALLECPGEVVTRAELTGRLWPVHTFVDFDRGLNKAINKLRFALRDHAEKPRYVETLPQRGYRFIAPVERSSRARDATRPHPATIDSLAVLPLQNLSGDPSQEYFSDGLTDELIGALAQIASLRVISRTSVMSYKGTRTLLPAIAKELGVDAVVQGAVLRSDQKVRITAQLILAAEEKHLWCGRYERDLREILQLQTEVAHSIAHEIHKLVAPEHARANPARHVHPQAYEACLKGNFCRDKMTPIDLEKSIGLFNRAIQLDPDYARAFGELAQTYFFLGIFGMGPPAEMFPKAKANAARALELDETIASAHNSLAAVHIFYDWDWAAAEREARRALELSPNESVTHAHFADYLSIRGRHSEAVAAYSRVLALDPISHGYIAHFGLILYRARRYDESIQQCRKSLEIDPDYVNALWFLALSLEQKGERREAMAALEKAVSLSQAPHHRALLGRAYALAGETAKAIDILDQLTALSERRYVSPFDLAVVDVGLGDRASAFVRLEEAYQQRVFRIVELTLPMFDDLRADPRWQSLVRRAGLIQ